MTKRNINSLKNSAQNSSAEIPIKSSDILYDAFISYSHKDIKIAVSVQKILEHWASYKKKGAKRKWLKIFRDDSDLSGGYLEKNIPQSLAQCRYLLVFCSENAEKSDYVWKEIELFYLICQERESDGLSCFMNHLLIAGCEQNDCDNKRIIRNLLEKALKDRLSPRELRQIVEKAEGLLYADYGSKKGIFEKWKHLRLQTYKLAAPMHGLKNTDDLINRAEKRRRTITIFTLLSAFAFLMVLFALNSYYRDLRDTDARRISLLAESRLEEGDRILASQLALASTRSKNLYRSIAPEALSVLSDAVHAYDMPSESRLEKSLFYRFNYSAHLSMDTSPDGKYLAATNEDGDIIVWDTESGRQILTSFAVYHPDYAKLKILDDERFLIYNYFSCKCYSLDTFTALWEINYQQSMYTLDFYLSDADKLSYILDDGRSDGLTNLTQSERKGQKVLLMAERNSGLVLRNPVNGDILASLPRETINSLLPEGVLFYKDINYYPFRSLINLQDSSEILYDPERDLYLLPCYKSAKYKTDGGGYTETVCAGILEWNPEKGEASYIDMEVSPAAGLESISYGPGCRILKLLDQADNAVLYCYDGMNGKLLWSYETLPSNLLREIRHRTCFCEEGILIPKGKSILVLDPETGKEKRRFDADLQSDEELIMILDGTDTFGTSRMQDILFLTSAGRICTISGDTLSVSEKSLSLSGNTASETTFKWYDCLYIPAERSCTGRASLFGMDTNGIYQYEVGVVNKRFRTVLTKDTDSSVIRSIDIPDTSTVIDDCILIKDKDGNWEFYELSQEEARLVWRIRPEDLSTPQEAEYDPSSPQPDLMDLSYLGRDPADGRLVLYEPHLGYFLGIDPDSGMRSFLPIPHLKNDSTEESQYSLIKEPVITSTGYCYISELLGEQTYSLSLFTIDQINGSTSRLDICEKEIKTKESQALRLFTDASGRYAFILSEWLNPLFIDTKIGMNSLKYFGIDTDIRDIWENAFFERGVGSICSFDSKGRYFAFNNKPLSQIELYDTRGNLLRSWNYFNTNISDMLFDGNHLMVLTSDGRILRLNLWNMKLQASQTLSHTSCSFKGISEDRKTYWIMDSDNSLYWVESDSLISRTHIRDTAALDLNGGRVFVFRDWNKKFVLGYMSLLSVEDILKEARALTGGREMTREEAIYYGVN